MGGDLVAAARQRFLGRPHHASPQTLDRLDQCLEPGGIEAVIVGEQKFHVWKVKAVAGPYSGHLQGRGISFPGPI